MEQNTNLPQENTQNQMPFVPIPPKSKNWTLIGMSIVLFFLSGTTIFLGWQNYQLKQQLTQLKAVPTPILIQPTIQPTPTITPTPTTGLTANWITYKNRRLGYQINYPSDWLVDETSEAKGFVYFKTQQRQKDLEAKKMVRIFDVLVRNYSSNTALPNNQDDNLSFENWIQQKAADYFCSDEGSETIIANNPAYHFVGNCHVADGSESWLVEKEGKIYEIEIEKSGKEDIEKEVEMMKSFRFL